MTLKNASQRHARRHFLQTAARASAAGVAAPFAMNLACIQAAAAQSTSDYRAIVCLFMDGANDHNNTVIPLDDASYTIYRDARGAVARKLDDLTGPGGESLELVPTVPLAGAGNAGRRFALPKELAALKSIWDSGDLAVLANVGTLAQPLTGANLASATLPRNLFSHNDQRMAWEAGLPGAPVNGWGGRMADLFGASNANGVFTSNSLDGQALFLSGLRTAGYQVGVDGSLGIRAINGNPFGATEGAALTEQLLRSSSAHPLARDLSATVARSIDANVTLEEALRSAPDLPLNAAEQGGRLAGQFRAVARMIAVRNVLGARRQIFIVRLGSFDTHSDQIEEQATLHADVARGLVYFRRVLTQLGMLDNVTTFTASDFGRALRNNGDGTDHGWGAHHFVMGGAVVGKRFYGTFPPLLGGFTDYGNGRLVPTTAVDQFAATLARWFGVTSATDMAMVLPNIGRFSATDLGFLG
jgi:uncharacterized protein (DUF1501 family)